MVVKMMKWRPWPPLLSKKFEVNITVHQLKGLNVLPESGDEKSLVLQDYARLAVEIKWKGSKGNALSLSSFRRSIKRNFTKEEPLREDGVVEWNEVFQSFCNFAAYKEGAFHPWEVTFTVFNVSNQGQNDKVPVIATASLDLASFGSATDQKEIEVNIPLQQRTSVLNDEIKSSLSLSLSLIEMRTSRETSEVVQTMAKPLPPQPGTDEILSTERDVKRGLTQVKIFRGLSTRRAKKESHEEEGSDGKSSVRSEDAQYIYPLDTDSVDDTDERESEEEKHSHIRKSFSYGTLAYVNQAGGLFYSNESSGEDEDFIYYTNRKTDSGNSYKHSTASALDQSSRHSPIHRILPWRKRKLSFRTSKAKGEPLLKRYYGDEGGDDIDHDRRQLSSSDESNFGVLKTEENQSSVSEFGDDNFAVGSWEKKELLSRDGHLKLQAEVFFSSIDQMSERAAGESACTALVAVIADWFQSNPDEMPIKSQLDSLIREGSLEWRNLCENETYRERFPDKHFDLETVLQAKLRPLSVVPEKSFIGFFHPEGIEEGEFNFLQGAMSFDNIWDEISRSSPDTSSSTDSVIYIVSWNDHFFILKVEQDAYYIIDTLGERLFEGCNHAFILKFDRHTAIHRVPSETQRSNDKPSADKVSQETAKKESIASGEEIAVRNEDESIVVCRGKDSCKEYIKSFLAAIPIRELQVDLKKGLMASTPLHHRLQIEFHYTKSLHPLPESYYEEKAIADTAAQVLAFAAV